MHVACVITSQAFGIVSVHICTPGRGSSSKIYTIFMLLSFRETELSAATSRFNESSETAHW